MANILAKPQNQICFDCGSKGPKWSSPYLGIVICYECAAKHRSFGTHISFVRSVDLDKWNRKQLKSLELTGNAYTKERFNDLGVPLIGGNYDYNNSMVLKVRQEIAEKVKESLKPDDYRKKDKPNQDEQKINFDDINISKPEEDEAKKNKDDDDKNKKENKEEEDKKKEKEKEEEKEKEKGKGKNLDNIYIAILSVIGIIIIIIVVCLIIHCCKRKTSSSSIEVESQINKIALVEGM
jgi:hypothetical protein